MFAHILKAYKDFNGSHVVFCLEGRSWRKDVYEPYKKNRQAARDALTPKEQEEDQAFWQAFDELKEFLDKRTNCTVLQDGQCEADDFIARWIQNHPDAEHVIVSSDSDFYQLLNANVTQYNGITNQHIKIDGVYNDKGKPVMDNKTGEQKQIGDPNGCCLRMIEVILAIMFSISQVSKKGSKNKVGMLEAFADKETKALIGIILCTTLDRS